MTEDAQLKLMAYVDGKLPTEEVAEIESLIKADQEAADLVSELRWAQEAITGNELELKVPETREFYWSKISKAIEFEEKQAERAATPSENQKWWNKILLPFAGLAAVALVFTFANPQSGTFVDDPGMGGPLESGVTLDEYYDEQEQTSMIWVTTDSEEEQKKRNRLNQDDTF